MVSNVWAEYDENDELIFIQGYTQDISDRKKYEFELQKSEEKYKNVIEHSTQMFYIHDTNHMLSYVSPQSKILFGYTPKEMMVKWTTLVTDNPINEKGFKITERTLSSGKKSEPYILEIQRKDGLFAGYRGRIIRLRGEEYAQGK